MIKLPQMFVESYWCKNRRVCDKCRSRDNGFRTALSKSYILPDGGVDFACPVGIPWEDEVRHGVGLHLLGDVPAPAPPAPAKKPCGCGDRAKI